MNVVMTAPQLAAEAVAVIEAAGGVLHYMKPYPAADEVAAMAGQVDAVAILTRQGPVSAAAMDAAPRLRIIARHGVGVDDVDVAEAVRRGIVVARAPGSNTTAVAEHTLAMILALVKQLGPLSATVAAGGWRGTAQVRDMRGLRLGLLGCGGIGQAVAQLAGAFGMDVAGYSRSGDGGGIAMLPNLDTLLARSDVLSLHLPMSPASHHIIDAAALARLPDQAIVVNTARGGLIDETALLAALDSGRLAGAGLDVFETEPPVVGDPLRGHARVIATPHVSGATAGSLVAMGVMAAECIAAVLRGEPVPAGRRVGV